MKKYEKPTLEIIRLDVAEDIAEGSVPTTKYRVSGGGSTLVELALADSGALGVTQS